MKRTFILIAYSIILILLFSNSCKRQEPSKLSESSKKEVVLSRFAKHYPDFNPQEFQSVLKELVMTDSILNTFYLASEYKPVWIHDTLDILCLKQVVDIFGQADIHGLDKNYFKTDYISELSDSIDNGYWKDNLDTLYYKLSLLEKTSTLSTIKYITGMKFGFLNPKKLYKKDYDITISEADSVFTQELYKQIRKAPLVGLMDAQPKDSVYLKLQTEYKSLKAIENEKFGQISSEGTYKLGDRSKQISLIAARLMLTKEYTPDPWSEDSLHMELNENLLDAINKFRIRNTYPTDKEVGRITIDALNRPISYYLDKITANLERYRWKRSKPKNEKHIEVNVAAFSLVATQADSLPLQMKVCVGTIGNKTPLLQSDISYINLNPTWNVPTSIAKHEVFVKQKKDPNYINRNNMKLFKAGQEVDPSTIDWKTADPNKLPYLIRQESGLGNSLGLIKFMFNNAFSVYLHDTPMKAAFGRKNRAVSHGCVRVQQPFNLAFFCMGSVSELYKDQLFFSVNKTPESKEGKKLFNDGKLKKLPNILNPKEKISLFIDYYTAYMYPQDTTLYYTDDVYGYDNTILEALKTL